MKTILFYILFSIAFLYPQNIADLTFIIASDTHYGKNEYVGSFNQETINAMNRISGIDYPDSIGGTVDTPLGVVISGDLTENGKKPGKKVYLDSKMLSEVLQTFRKKLSKNARAFLKKISKKHDLLNTPTRSVFARGLWEALGDGVR